jgi:hypothetical protein
MWYSQTLDAATSADGVLWQTMAGVGRHADRSNVRDSPRS